MPLLDAVLAFALTMLALSSLVGMLQEQIHRLRNLRRRHFLAMMDRFLEEHVIPAARGALERAGPDAEARFGDLRAALEQAREKPAGEERGLARLAVLGLDKLHREVAESGRTHLSADELVERLRGTVPEETSVGLRTALGEASVDAADVESRWREAWEELGDEFTETFRKNAKVSATRLALLLAFVLNVDSLHLLEVYMTDDGSRSAVVALEPTEVTAAKDGDPRTQVAVVRSSGFPIGWDLYPNCPPESTDSRCHDYWLRAGGGSAALDFEEREAINPLLHPRVALGLFLDETEPAPTAVHTSTDGGPPGVRPTGSANAEARLGALPRWPLVEWVLGCLLTGLLAGLGSPFWIEVVRSLGRARDHLRDARKKQSNAS